MDSNTSRPVPPADTGSELAELDQRYVDAAWCKWSGASIPAFVRLSMRCCATRSRD